MSGWLLMVQVVFTLGQAKAQWLNMVVRSSRSLVMKAISYNEFSGFVSFSSRFTQMEIARFYMSFSWIGLS